MATTTNYAWETPDDTDLVKDGAAAIRTLGSSIDTTTKALNPSTTLGDIEYRSSTANTNTRLGIGTTGQVLTVASGVPSWATPATPTSGLTKIAAASFSGVSTVDIDSVFSATYDNYLVFIKAYSSVSDADLQLQLRFAGPSTRTSGYYGSAVKWGRTGTATNFGSDNASAFTLSDRLTAAAAYMDYINLEFNCMNTTSQFPVMMGDGFVNTGSEAVILGATNSTATAYTGFRLLPSSGTITGNYYVYGVQN